ncbi:glycosyltransferase family 4 protein [Halobacillus mangrovi]|uniref:Glycosyl transferase family 1 domain-containing protein n=1 Tax=Halobacillus mangrovi TaxID=402384 RepID=A0A1W5ZSI8_9BACI|nr:glycosyltransferase family 4 protein [Halobacillus mangrovi]ARI76258.1 hypothetical protein HM131_05145 [Halobacillus mangrovi]
MEVLVAADSLIYKTPDGKFWCKTIYGYNFWLRYLEVFERVSIVSRTHSVDYSEVTECLRVDGPNVRVLELPFMRGMKDYITNYFSFSKTAKKIAKEGDCAIIRLPSVVAAMVHKYYKRTGKPYALEIVADPHDAYASNKLAQLAYTKQLKNAALQANGVSYVTQFYLQSKYPSFSRLYGETDENFESYYSTINLSKSYFSLPKTFNNEKKQFTIVHTANSINNDMKGHDTLIKVLKQLREENYDVNIIFIGDGSKRKYYEQMAHENGVGDFVTFTGLLPSGEKVREFLLKGDIFVFPTKAEGLPRAIIEAMAVGLPVLSTPVNGIPELLPETNMFDPYDVNGFVNKLKFLFKNVSQLEEMSKENLNTAEKYVNEKLSIRRKNYYRKLRIVAEKLYETGGK